MRSPRNLIANCPALPAYAALSLALLLLLTPRAHPQNTAPPSPNPNPKSSQPLAGTQSIGDMVHSQDTAASPTPSASQPIHIVYIHGISQVGAGDSSQLRAAICKYIGECTVTRLARIYADGPFAPGAPPPPFTYLQHLIWISQNDWRASAPFIDRYSISGGGHTPLLLDEINWWPLVYPLKCKALIASDAHLTGPSQAQLRICSAPTEPDPANPGRFLQYQWIPTPVAAALGRIHRRAALLNRDLKNGLMDWGFGDAVIALGPLQQILTSGIRQLLSQSLAASSVDAAHPSAEDSQVFFITHSLGSYLALASLDAEWLGSGVDTLPQFAVTPAQKSAADNLSAHTAGFYFLANQIEFLELARVSANTNPSPNASPDPCAAAPATPSGTTPTAPPASASIAHWDCERQLYLRQRAAAEQAFAGHGPPLLGPQIVAWSDPDDLLSWNVPQIASVRVVNLHVTNKGFKIPPFFAWPTGAHDNYAENPRVLRIIFRRTSEK